MSSIEIPGSGLIIPTDISPQEVPITMIPLESLQGDQSLIDGVVDSATAAFDVLQTDILTNQTPIPLIDPLPTNDQLVGCTLPVAPLPPTADVFPVLSNPVAPVLPAHGYAEPSLPVAPNDIGEITITDVAVPIFAGAAFAAQTFDGVTPVTPTFPTAPTIEALEALVPAPLDSIPVLAVTDLSVVFPEAPADFIGAAPLAPNLVDPTVPSAPDANLPTLATLASITLPESPEIFFPTFTATLVVGPTAPSDTFSFDDKDYGSALLTNLQTKLEFFLGANTTGLADVIWQNIWERAREREDGLAVRTRDEANQEFSARGFALPPGALVARDQEIVQGNQEKAGSLSREQAIKEADLEVENVRFAITSTIELEIALIDNFNQKQTRAMEAARLSVTLVQDLFRIEVELYNSDVLAFRAQAEVFAVLLKAEITKVDVLKAEIEGQRLILEVNASEIANYRAQIDAVVATFDLYRAQLEAARFTIDQNRLRIDEFQALVQAFNIEATVAATRADIYGTKVNAERGKIDLRRSEIEAFSQQVNAFSVVQQTRIASKGQEIDIERFKIETFGARVQSFDADIRSKTSQLAADVDVFNALVAKFSAQTDGEGRRVAAESDVFTSEIAAFAAEVQKEVDAGRVSIDAANSRVSRFGEEVRLHGSRADSEGNRINAVITGFKAEIDGFNSITQRDVNVAQAIASKAAAQAQLFSAEVQGFAATSNAIVGCYNADVNKFRADVEAFGIRTRAETENTRITSQELIAAIGFITERVIAEARIAGQIAAATLSQTNHSNINSSSQSVSQSQSASHNLNIAAGGTVSTVFQCECGGFGAAI